MQNNHYPSAQITLALKTYEVPSAFMCSGITIRSAYGHTCQQIRYIPFFFLIVFLLSLAQPNPTALRNITTADAPSIYKVLVNSTKAAACGICYL